MHIDIEIKSYLKIGIFELLVFLDIEHLYFIIVSFHGEWLDACIL